MNIINTKHILYKNKYFFIVITMETLIKPTITQSEFNDILTHFQEHGIIPLKEKCYDKEFYEALKAIDILFYLLKGFGNNTLSIVNDEMDDEEKDEEKEKVDNEIKNKEMENKKKDVEKDEIYFYLKMARKYESNNPSDMCYVFYWYKKAFDAAADNNFDMTTAKLAAQKVYDIGKKLDYFTAEEDVDYILSYI